MATVDTLRAVAFELPGVSERPAPRAGFPQFMTNGRCFASLPAANGTIAEVLAPPGERDEMLATSKSKLFAESSTEVPWVLVRLPAVSEADLRTIIGRAWRQRAKKTDVHAHNYAVGIREIEPILARLRNWPELKEVSPGNFHAGGRAFLHFHHADESRSADVKNGPGWGAPIELPLGRPSQTDVRNFLKEVRTRLMDTLKR